MTFFFFILPDSYNMQEGVQYGLAFASPNYIDSADADNIYLGYCRVLPDLTKDDTTLLIVNVVTTNDVTIKSYAYGAWADRATLQYT